MNLIKPAAFAAVLLAAVALLPSSAEARGRHHVEHRAGHYETRVVQRWVEGRYEQRWIEGACYESGHRHQVRHRGDRHQRGRHHHASRLYCEPGRYEQTWIPGHYVSVSEQVWVPHRRWAWTR